MSSTARDATYSPFVAAQTSLRDGLEDVPVIWCFNPYWMEQHHNQILGQTERSTRLDALIKRTPLLVTHDNPYFLNRRLTAHQGVFLCPGDISKPFVKNLKRMNVSSTVLFPGLDSFARSLGEELPHYDEIYVSKLPC